MQLLFALRKLSKSLVLKLIIMVAYTSPRETRSFEPFILIEHNTCIIAFLNLKKNVIFITLLIF
jgi:hypothetical protein